MTALVSDDVPPSLMVERFTPRPISGGGMSLQGPGFIKPDRMG